MPGGFSCGRDGLEGRQGIVQTVTRSALNSSAGTGSNDTNLLAVLPMGVEMEGRCPSIRHMEEPAIPFTPNHPTGAGRDCVQVISHPWPGWTG